MKLIADIGTTQFSLDEKEQLCKKVVHENQDTEKDVVISGYDLFRMLEALPEGVKWNPCAEQFEKDGKKW